MWIVVVFAVGQVDSGLPIEIFQTFSNPLIYAGFDTSSSASRGGTKQIIIFC